MNKAKLIWYSGTAIIFLMYWGMFSAFSNWWIGLILAAITIGTQTLVQRMLDKVKVE